MSMTSLALTSGATPTITGGSTVTYSPNNAVVPNGISLVDASVSDFRLRPTIIGKYRAPMQTGPSSFSKAKVSFTLRVPKLKSDGTYVYNFGRLEIEYDPECTTAEQDNIANQIAQLAFDSDTLNFRRVGSIA